MTDNGTPQFIVVLGEIGEGLVRIPLAKIGRWYKGKQRFAITRQDMDRMVANFAKRGTGEVVIDYDHSTEFAAGGGEPAPASGWLKEIEPEPDAQGILWGQAEFTDRARAMLKAHEYKYISPVINWGSRDRNTGDQQGATITSLALTNQPVLQEMPAIALSDAGWVADATESQPKESKPMKAVLSDRAAGKVRVIADDGAETVLLIEGLEPQPKVLRLSDVKRGQDGRFDFASLPQDGDTLVASEVIHGMQVQGELDAAVQAGKILPAQRPVYEKLALSDLEGFRGLVKSMKTQVELSERGVAGSGQEQLSELEQVEQQIDLKTKEKLTANPKLQYHEAFKLVASENPELDRRRTHLIRERR